MEEENKQNEMKTVPLLRSSAIKEKKKWENNWRAYIYTYIYTCTHI
jgi:hypothetical protein